MDEVIAKGGPVRNALLFLVYVREGRWGEGEVLPRLRNACATLAPSHHPSSPCTCHDGACLCMHGDCKDTRTHDAKRNMSFLAEHA